MCNLFSSLFLNAAIIWVWLLISQYKARDHFLYQLFSTRWQLGLLNEIVCLFPGAWSVFVRLCPGAWSVFVPFGIYMCTSGYLYIRNVYLIRQGLRVPIAQLIFPHWLTTTRPCLSIFIHVCMYIGDPYLRIKVSVRVRPGLKCSIHLTQTSTLYSYHQGSFFPLCLNILHTAVVIMALSRVTAVLTRAQNVINYRRLKFQTYFNMIIMSIHELYIRFNNDKLFSEVHDDTTHKASTVHALTPTVYLTFSL